MLRKFKVNYFAASCDDVETNTKFAKSLELDFPILSDPTCATALAYGVVEGDGKYPARHTFYIGQDGKVLKVDRAVKPSTAGADVAAHLAALDIPEAPKD
jgi:peroxiredoxin Q/BCP